MIELKTPRGLSVAVPESPAEDPSPKFSAQDTSSIKDYYDLNGYAIVKNLFDSQDCDAIRDLWDREVKPSTETTMESARSTRDRAYVALNTAKWHAASVWCAQQGMKFRVVTENQIFHKGKPR